MGKKLKKLNMVFIRKGRSNLKPHLITPLPDTSVLRRPPAIALFNPFSININSHSCLEGDSHFLYRKKERENRWVLSCDLAVFIPHPPFTPSPNPLEKPPLSLS